MSSSHRLSGDVYVTNPTTGAQITENDGTGSTRNCEKAYAAHTTRSHEAQEEIRQETKARTQRPQGIGGRKLHTKHTMVDKERKMDSGGNGETEQMSDVRDSAAQMMRDDKVERVNDMHHSRSESTRRSARAKSQHNEGMDDGRDSAAQK